MHTAVNFELRKKRSKDLSVGLCLYGANEPPETQLENMWEVVDRYTGAKLVKPKRDLSEFEDGDIMYSSMRKPETQARWDNMELKWKEDMERYKWIKRAAHARFMFENPEHRLSRSLAKTDYGKELLSEFGQRSQQSTHNQPQTGTDTDLHEEFEFEQDRLNSGPENAIRTTPFVIHGSSKPFSVLATSKNKDGRIIEKQLTLTPLNHHLKYEYDAGGRLHKVWKGKQLIEEYLYGKAGERYFGATPQTGQRRFSYGPGLRPLKAGDVKYSYDDQGRLIMKQDNLDVTKYEYHQSGQLQQVVLPDGRRISYIIDPSGKRIAKQVNGRTVESYGWHDFNRLAAVVDGEGRNRKEFAYNNAGTPIAMRFNDEDYYFASDQAGTIYLVVDDNGDEVKRIIYDSFGNTIVDTNDRISIPLGFAAGLQDHDTGLIHFGHREYDPSTGRFIQPDPNGLEGGDVDVYGYCDDDPVNFTEFNIFTQHKE